MTADQASVLKPYKLASLDLRNRISFNSTVCMIGVDHAFDDARIEYYAERSKGGVGLVITEGLSVHPTSVPTPTVPIVHDEANIPNFKKLADAVHRHGAAIFGQLWHVGRQSLWSPFLTPWSASGQRDPLSGTTPHAMTEAEIETLIGFYARSAVNLEEAGFDGAELHSAHGYLPQQFLSPWSNWRTDRWGGVLENRARFLVEIIRRIRSRVGPRFVLGIKLATHEYVAGGIDLAESKRIVAHLMSQTPLDFIEVSVANFSPSLERHVPDLHFPDTPFRELCAGIREVAGSAAVMAVAKIPDIDHAEELVRAGHADMVGMVRPLLADPHLVAKHVQGVQPRPCVYCNICWDMTHQLRPVACFYAPEKETEPDLLPVSEQRTIRIVGAGPAGLELARVAASRGHDVHLYDRNENCGGRLLTDSKVPGRERIGKARQWLKEEALRAGVQLNLGTNIGVGHIRQWPEEDIVVQATGAVADAEPLPGDPSRLSLEDVIDNPTLVVGNVAIIDEIEDEPVYSVAEMLAARGHKVRLVTRRASIGRRTPHVNMIGAFRRLDEAGEAIDTMVVPSRIENGQLIAAHGLSGIERALGEVSTVVYAGPYKATPAFENAGRHIHIVGDAYAPRALLAVVRQANAMARQIEQLSERSTSSAAAAKVAYSDLVETQ